MGYAIAISPCFACKRIFGYNPLSVPSVRDQSNTKQPVCRDCMAVVNAKRRQAGLEPFEIRPDAYEPVRLHQSIPARGALWSFAPIPLLGGRMNERELATVLAALRTWQSRAVYALADTHQQNALVDIATDNGRFEALKDEEIDALCERLNARADDLYLVTVEGGVEPQLLGPYSSLHEQNQAAQEIHAGLDDNDSIFGLDISVPATIWAFPAAFFDGEIEGEI